MGFISLWKFFSYLMNVSLLKLFSWKMILEKSLRASNIPHAQAGQFWDKQFQIFTYWLF